MNTNFAIAVWNLERSIRKSSRTRESQARRLSDLKADLLLLTEVDRTFEISGYSAFFSGKPTDPVYRPEEVAAGIYFRWDDSPELIPIGEAANLAVCIRLPRAPVGPLIVYCSIIPYHACDVSKGAKTWQRHQESAKRQADDWERQRNRYRDDLLIVGGDFNQALDGTGRYKNKRSLEILESGFARSGLECMTRDDFTRAGLSRHGVDHVAIDRRLVDENTVTVTAWEGTSESARLSDHNGVTVEIHGKR